MSGSIRKLIGSAKMRLQHYVEEASSLPSSTVEEKTVTEDELRVEKVIAAGINTNVSLLERCNRYFIKGFEDRRKGQRGEGVPTSSRGK